MKKMKILKFLAVTLLLFSLFAIPAAAEDKNGAAEFMEGANILEGASDGTKTVLDQFEIDGWSFESILKLSPGKLIAMIFENIAKMARLPLVTLLLICGVIVVTNFINGASYDNNMSVSGTSKLVCVLVCSTAIINPAINAIKSLSSAIYECGNFLTAFTPAFVSVVTTMGKPVTGGVISGLLFFLAQFITNISSSFIVPLLFIFLSLSIASTLSQNINLDGLIKILSKAIKWMLGLFTSIFTGILTLQTIISDSVDSTATRALKYAAASYIPIVGGAIAESINTTFGALSLLKNTVGIIGIIILLAILFIPVLQSAVWLISFKLAGAAAEILGAAEIEKILKAVCDTITIILAITVTVFIMIVFCVTFITVVVK